MDKLNTELFDTIHEFDTSKIPNEEMIEAKKKYSFFNSQIMKKAKQTKCILCGKECTSFCNSHTIPRFVLKNISNKGYLAHSYSGLQMPLIEKETGVNKTLTFSCICNNCDNTKFQEYENPDNYKKPTTKVMMSQIALKNTLRMYSKRLIEIEMHKELLYVDPTSYQRIKVDEIDLNDYKNEIMQIKNGKTDYYLIDEIELNYRTSIAFQGICSLVSGFGGEQINDIYNMDSKYEIQGLHIAIFPISEGKTKILLFIKDGHTRLRPFYKKYRKLNLKEKLYAINYILLLYSEDWVCNPSSIKILSSDEKIKEIIKTNSNSTIQFGDEFDRMEFKKKVKEASLSKFKLQFCGELYNFLENHEDEN